MEDSSGYVYFFGYMDLFSHHLFRNLSTFLFLTDIPDGKYFLQ
jgi:hypothetical protein